MNQWKFSNIEQVNELKERILNGTNTSVENILSEEQAFIVNFGVMPGHDVISEDESIICECFAATTPDSNGKLEKDVKKVYENKNAIKKYVIFLCSNLKKCTC